MLKRILIVGAIFIVFATAIIANLAILDVIEISLLGDSLGKVVSIIAVTTVAVAFISILTKQTMTK